MITRFKQDGSCHLIFGYVPCYNNYLCHMCELADRVRDNKAAHPYYENGERMFDWSDCLGTTPKAGGAEWYHRLVVFKSDVLERKGYIPNLINQMFYCVDGPGVFPWNENGEIDGYFVYNPEKMLTFTRMDFYGVPCDRSIELYSLNTGISLRKYVDVKKK